MGRTGTGVGEGDLSCGLAFSLAIFGFLFCFFTFGVVNLEMVG